MFKFSHYIQRYLEEHWYNQPKTILSIILYPISQLFGVVTKIRHCCYKYNLLKSYSLPVPVVVIGNLNIGGVGKTPLCLHIAQQLEAANISCGVILRGYKGKNTTARVITANDMLASDEALIYASNNIKVATANRRIAAANELIKMYPNIQIILSDDGLQHYALRRDFEIAVLNNDLISPNLNLLPDGSWREKLNRLNKVDHIVINTTNYPNTLKQYDKPITIQKIVLEKIYNPLTNKIYTITELNHLKILSMAGIGQPNKFFKFLAELGIQTTHNIAKTDHHDYTKQDIPDGFDVIIVTDKDYQKLKYLNISNLLVAKITIELDSTKLMQQIKALVKA